MAADSTKTNDPAGCRPSRSLGAWARLGAGMAVIGLFMFVVGPWGLRLPGFSTMSAFIRDRDLKATALYYTDIEEVGQAIAGLDHSLRFAPRPPGLAPIALQPAAPGAAARAAANCP